MAKKPATDVATTEKEDPQALALQALKNAGFDMSVLEADSDAGNTNVTQQDVATPYLYVLQPLSPQAQPAHDAYIEGAAPGMFLNNAAQEVYDADTGLLFIPAFYERKLVEWVDRDAGGGWVGEHDITSDIMDFAELVEDPIKKRKTLRMKADPTHILVETAYHYGLFRHPVSGLWLPIVVPMKSTMLKVNRQLNQIITNTVIPGSGKKAPRWLYPFMLGTRAESDGKNTWHTITFKREAMPVSLDEYNMAKSFAKLVESGDVQRKAETNDQPDKTEDDDIPM